MCACLYTQIYGIAMDIYVKNMYMIKVKEGLHRESREHSEGRRDKEEQLSRAQWYVCVCKCQKETPQVCIHKYKF